MKPWLLLCAVAWPLLAGLEAYAEPESADSARIRELEAQVRELSGLASQVEDLKLMMEDLSRAPAVPAASLGPANDSKPELEISAFGDFDYRYSRHDPSAGSTARENRFRLGNLDLFLSARLSDRVSFFSELLFHPEQSGAEISVQRLLARVQLHEKVDLLVGRGHTALSYWNRTFHHGGYLQTTISTPLILGKLLPRHFVGLALESKLSSTLGTATATLEVANGRGLRQGQEQNLFDADKGKMMSLVLGVEPEIVPGLGLTLAYTRDEIGGDPANVLQARGQDEQIASASLYYDLQPWELLFEGHWVRHDDLDADERNDSHGGYAQIAHEFEQVTPYYRFEWLEVREDDPFYAAADTRLHTAGLRFDWTPHTAVKVEYRHADQDASDADSLHVNLSFGF